jgi:hypothetical protein
MTMAYYADMRNGDLLRTRPTLWQWLTDPASDLAIRVLVGAAWPLIAWLIVTAVQVSSMIIAGDYP